MRRLLKLIDRSETSPTTFWLCLAFLFLSVLALHGKTVPYNNEFLYLLRLEPNFLPHDWTFSLAATEHWLFNLIFSLPARVVSIETLGWAGRVVFWILCLVALIKLGKRWEIPYWSIVISIGTWLAIGQSVVNAEWIFGTFEAKCVAYACLLFAINGFAERSIILPSVLLGLSFSFHPAVGLWAIPAVGFALAIERVAFADLIKFICITGLFSLPGALPLLLEQSGADAATWQDWQFVVTVHMPFHFDPFYFSKVGMAVLALMLAFNMAALWRSESYALRLIRNFQVAIAAFFVLGVVLRWFEVYPALRFMPMRLFPILTPLFFLFTAFYLFRRQARLPYKIAVALFVVLVTGMLHPIDNGIGQLRETKANWVARPDDLETSLAWISKNTPEDAVILASPFSRKFWYLAKRAQIVSYSYPRYERLAEWRRRIAETTANTMIPDRASSRERIETGFESLSITQVAGLKEKYSANYLLTRSVYPFPVIFETGTYKVYQIP